MHGRKTILFLKFEGIDGWLLPSPEHPTSLTIEGFPEIANRNRSIAFSGETHISCFDYTMELPLGNLNDGQTVYFGTFVAVTSIQR
jgi:hypothetical protein